MGYVINVDLEALNARGRHPTGCRSHQGAGPHYDVTIHAEKHVKPTHRSRRYWLGGFKTLTDARNAAAIEARKVAALVRPRGVLVREHGCV